MFRHLANCLVLISLIGLNGCDDVPDLSLPNEPPLAVDDNISIKQNQEVSIAVLANDFDIDGDQLTVVLGTEPSNGTAEALTGLIRYTPDLYFVGTDEFSYEITDIAGHTSTATVSIDIAKRETRAIFSTMSGTEETLYMLDSRDPGTLVNLGQSLNPGETILNWAISQQLQLAVLLTDADRILTVPLDDPATPANMFDLDTSNGPIDGGLLLSSLGTRAVYTLDHRYAIDLDLNGVNDPVEIDTLFDTGTMLPVFFSPLDTGIVMAGTLGAGVDEHSAIYFVSLIGVAPIAILDDATIVDPTFSRRLSGLNAMAWLIDESVVPVPPAAYNCTTPPSQTLSDLSYTLLSSPGPGTNLNDSSGLLADPTNLISYNNATGSSGIVVAACPPAANIVQIIEIPFATPENARIIATGEDASDGLWNIDIGNSGENIIYAVDGDTGFRTMSIDLSGTDPVVSDLTSTVPNYQTYTAGTELLVPPSVFSTDGLRWLFLAPVSDVLTRLEWLQIESSELNTLDLPFTASNLVSDGFFAIVQGATAGTGSAPVALIDLEDPQVTAIDVPGELAETVADPLNQIESAIHLFPVP